jgi:peptidyl-prolyl cis-trans isomerase C
LLRAFPLIAALVVWGCSKTPAQADTTAVSPANAASAQTTPTPEAPPKPVPAQIPDVVARVNGEAVSRAEFERAVQALESRAGGPVPPEQRDQVLRGVVDQLVGYRLLVQESKTRNVAVPDGDVDARMKEIQGQFPSEDAFKQLLAERKMTIEQVKSDARQDMAISKLIESEISSKIAVKAEQVADFYAKNPDQFKQGESVRASHILIGVPRDADAAAKAQARAKADQILKDVKAGKDFAALAKEHSSDPGSAANGGDLGAFQQGQMVGPFNDAAFSLAPGGISDVVETEFGFHIIKVAEKKPGRTIPLDEVRPQVEQYLEQMNRQQQTDAFVNGLRVKGKVEVLM